MNKRFLILILLLLLAACSEDKKDDTPSTTPTSTPVTAGYTGPLLGSSSLEESSECSAGGGCSGSASEVVEAVEESLPLTEQTVEVFSLGIPEGYSPLVVADEVIITAVSAETIGGFTVILRRVEEADLADILEKYEQPHFEAGTAIENETLTGHSLPNSNLGTIALLRSAEGQMVFVEGFATPGYWPAFSVTFDAMVETLELTP